MNCKNCGWPNRKEAKVCIKCGAPLDSAPQQPIQPASQPQSIPFHQAQPQMPPQPTVTGEIKPVAKPIAPPPGFAPQPAPQAAPHSAPQAAPKVAPQPAPQPVPHAAPQPTPQPAPQFNPAEAAAKAQREHRATVNVYTAPAVENSFTLTPVRRIGEPVQPKTNEFSGPKTILNRDNTDPENPSITSRQQAAISNINGKWVITDLSDQQTTFVRPSEGYELRDGDTILLGNRLFIFHTK